MTETILIALAAWRLWRLFALDVITDPIRDRIPESSTFYTFLICPWCSGAWWTLTVWAVTWAVLGSLPAPGLVLGGALALSGAFGTADRGWHER